MKCDHGLVWRRKALKIYLLLYRIAEPVYFTRYTDEGTAAYRTVPWTTYEDPT